MSISLTRYVLVTWIGTILLSSCSHPVAYFLKSTNPAASSLPANMRPVPETTPRQPPVLAEASLVQVDAALDPVDAYVRNERGLGEYKKLGRRLNRIQHLLVTTHPQRVAAPGATPRKMNGIERLLVRKMTKQIRQQGAATHPDKAMVANRLQLVGGIVLLLGGLLLLILGSGTVAFIGLILSLVGAVGVIVSLFGT